MSNFGKRWTAITAPGALLFFILFISSSMFPPVSSGQNHQYGYFNQSKPGSTMVQMRQDDQSPLAAQPRASEGGAVNVNEFPKASVVVTSTLPLYLPLVRKAPGDLKSLINVSNFSLPIALEGTSWNWCTWSYCYLSPRLYQEPLGANQTLVGWTDVLGDGHTSLIIGSSINRTDTFTGLSVHGLAVHSDGKFAVLLWNSSTATMWLSKRNADGSEIWKTNLNSTIAHADFDVGDSRLAYGSGQYAAYFTVYGVADPYTGHNGDQLTFIDDAGNKQSGGWSWGCSHSMAELVNYHPELKKFIPVCSSDCYASKGILIQDSKVVYPGDGDCRGLVSAQLGQVVPNAGGWELVFNALNRPSYAAKGIGLATIDESFQSSFVWLTNTQGDYERDPVLARLGTTLNTDLYLVGWTTSNDGKYWLGVIDGSGNFKVGLENVTSAGIRWGNRDDSLRTRQDGSVSWVQGDAGSNVLRLFRFDSSAILP
jgi:hypothetical protein